MKQGLDFNRLLLPAQYRASLNVRVAELEMK
ncbi:DNA-binding transcriptional regulator/RsmH inhibitor MraZ [Oxalobacteraceae bacterium GrIS 1.11]